LRILTLAFGPERARIAGVGLLCGALMLSFGFEGPIVARGVAAASLGVERPDLAVGLLVVTVGYVWAGITTVRRVTENLLLAVMLARRRLIEATLRSDLATMERVGSETVLSSLTRSPDDIMATAPLLARGMRTGCYIIGTLVVLAALAWQLFAVMAGILFVIFFTLVINHPAVMSALREAGELEAASRDDLRGMVLGFKELRLNDMRRRQFLGDMQTRVTATLTALARANLRQTISFVLQATATLAASGVCIFVIPNLVPDASAVTMVSAAVLMSNMSLALVRDIPLLTRGEAAAGEMEGLHTQLRPSRERAKDTAAVPSPPPTAVPLTVEALCYQYLDDDDEPGFAFGPLSLSFQPGTVTFILGSNSSGKTTLIKLLAGLYQPAAGTIQLGGAEVTPAVLREHVSAVFDAPYIFDRLYGWPDAEPDMVNGLLADMGIGGRVQFADGRFSTVDLSTGQRKRLAWVVAMIEDRPILLLDQWAADQDPEFRDHFYHVMLPRLRAAGRTVIAVTNDDRYYDVADRLIRLEDGLVVS
jgi:putative pyoverdin transport system ATP-binding/permease protein